MMNRRRFPLRISWIAIALTGTTFVSPAVSQNQDTSPSVSELAKAQEARDRTLQEYREQARLLATKEIERAQSALDRLRTAANDLGERLKALATNEDGKRLAGDRAAVSLIFHRGLLNPPVSKTDIDSRSAEIDEIKRKMATAQGTDLDPVVERAREQAFLAAAWVNLKSAELSERQSYFDGAIKAAPPKGDGMTLREALDSYSVAFDRWSVDLFRKGVEQGKTEKEDELVERGRLAALLESEQKLRLLEEDIRVRLKEEQARKEAEMERQLDRVAELERDNQRLRSERALKDAQNDAAVSGVARQTERERLRDRARSVEVRGLLANLSTAGFKQPGKDGVMRNESVKKQPVSLTDLRSSGALDSTPKGLQFMMKVLTDARDTDRPRKAFSRKAYGELKGEEKEWLQQLQSTITELGDALVEVGLLSP